MRYVKPSLHRYLLTAGVLIVALAIASIVADICRGGPGDDGRDQDSRPYWLQISGTVDAATANTYAY